MNGTLPAQEPDMADQNWQSLYQSALVETDRVKLRQHILSFEQAVFLRWQVLLNSNSDSDAERHAMQVAMRALQVLLIEKVNYPDGRPNKKRPTENSATCTNQSANSVGNSDDKPYLREKNFPVNEA
jgi:hypothetical protein